ncbi:hypothetical protein EI94DRAFT_1807364 [Lactarius quietus]|nr:hypothetical protein EI94DRAFT_1807364 [Lactarius quietus]
MSRLTLQYQLQSGGSHLTLEELQVIENKHVHLQKLIDMFEHQANGFLLHHGPMDDMSIPPLADYAEYDHIDDIHNSRATAMIPHISNPSGGDGPHSKDIPILLPSTIGWQWCASHGVKSLALKEAKLCYAQATDSIHAIRPALGFKPALFRTQNYGMARDAYEKIKDPSQTSPELPPLTPADLQVNTAILGAAQKGQ